MTIAISTLCTIVFGGAAVWGFLTTPGLKGKAYVLAVFLGGIFLAATTFGIWLKATTADVTGKTITTVDNTIK
jgi:hypothetical protein